ncbi:MAG: hypothetical protein JSV19_04610 [Phycisphaerales bacterium]|nr:MAG: hypothetical protein JSV19_04610 [Phycisphaerales bacterium]
MKAHRILFCMLAIAPVTGAKETRPAHSPVLSLAPADAGVIVYADKPAGLLGPLTATVPAEEADVRASLKSATELFSGPTLVAVVGTPMALGEFRIEFATRLSRPEIDFFKKLDELLLTELAKDVFGGSAGKVESSGLLRIIRLPGPLPIALFTAAKDGIVYGSTRRANAEAWLEGHDLDERFVASDEYKRLFGEKPTTPDALVYFDLRPFIPLLEMEAGRQGLSSVFSTLELERLESAGLTAQWSTPELKMRLAVAMADGEGGLAELLAPRNGALEIPSVLPPDYTFFVRGAFCTAADSWNWLNDLLDAVDPDIVREFNQECAEFRNDFGFDPHTDFLGNFIDEWMFAGRIDATGIRQWVTAARVANPDLFRSHVAALTAAFELPFATWTYGDVFIQAPPPDAGPRFAMACIDDYMIVTSDSEAMQEIVDARSEGTTAMKSRGLASLTRHLPKETSCFVFADLAQLCNVFVDAVGNDCAPPAEIIELMRNVARSKAAAGVTVSTAPGLLAFDAVLSNAMGSDARQVLWESLTASLGASREQSKRLVSAANVKGIVVSCLIHANEHKGAWPDAMSQLVRDGSCAPEMFRSPFQDKTTALTVDNVDRESYYLYRPGTGLEPQEVVVCERELRGGGANFGYADGHVEWVEGDRAVQLLAKMKQMAN